MQLININCIFYITYTHKILYIQHQHLTLTNTLFKVYFRFPVLISLNDVTSFITISLHYITVILQFISYIKSLAYLVNLCYFFYKVFCCDKKKYKKKITNTFAITVCSCCHYSCCCYLSVVDDNNIITWSYCWV